MTELDLAMELGLIKKRSNGFGHFDNTIILNHRLLNYILSLKREKDEREKEVYEIDESFELAEEDTISQSPIQSSDEKIFELPPLKNIEWEMCDVVIDHPTYKPKVILNIIEYKECKAIEMSEKFDAEDLEELRRMSDTAS